MFVTVVVATSSDRTRCGDAKFATSYALPGGAPKANAYAERWVRTVRTECLDWILIWNRRHLQHVLDRYVAHYDTARPHRGIDLNTPITSAEPSPVSIEHL
jgi:transposase InsO family protein